MCAAKPAVLQGSTGPLCLQRGRAADQDTHTLLILPRVSWANKRGYFHG